MINKIIKESKKYIFLQIIFFIISTIALALIPILNKILVDDIISKNSFKGLKIVALYYLIAIIGYLVFTFLSEKFVWLTAIVFENKMQKNVFSKLTDLSYQEYSTKKTEGYYALLTKNITQIEQDYLTPKISLYKSGFSILIYGSILLFYNKTIFSITFILSILVVLFPKIFKGRLKLAASTYIKQNEKYANIVNELLRAFDLLDSKVKKSFNKKFSEQTDDLSEKRLKFGSIKVISNLLSGGSIMILEMIVIIISVYYCMIGIISVGEVIMFLSYSKSFTDPLTEILYCINAINSTEDIRKDLDAFSNINNIPEKKKSLYENNKLVIRNTSVDYSEKKYIYNYDFNKGKKYAIYGESGSGKSTLLKLIAGKLPNKAIVNSDINFSMDDIAYLSQDQIIFSDSFGNNISLFGAYDERDILANYEINEKYLNKIDVSSMSGGEKQYIKVLRSLAQKKPLLLLDEPTTGMDYVTACKVVDYISKLDTTVLLVTHNLSVIDSDKWCLLDIDEVRESV